MEGARYEAWAPKATTAHLTTEDGCTRLPGRCLLWDRSILADYFADPDTLGLWRLRKLLLAANESERACRQTGDLLASSRTRLAQRAGRQVWLSASYAFTPSYLPAGKCDLCELPACRQAGVAFCCFCSRRSRRVCFFLAAKDAERRVLAGLKKSCCGLAGRYAK